MFLVKFVDTLAGLTHEFRLQGRIWDLTKKRQQYKQGKKSRVTDLGGEGHNELQNMLPPLPTLKGRFNLSPNPRRRTLEHIDPAINTSVDLDKINGEVCFLVDSPYRIHRVSHTSIYTVLELNYFLLHSQQKQFFCKL